MPRRSPRLDGGLAVEDEIATALRAARIRLFKAALDDYGVQGNPYALRGLAARIGVHASTLHGWESCQGRPQSFATYHRWAHAVGKRFAVMIDGKGIEN
ncbi:hypothetical protein LCGC14_2876650 [marine sediment metagenome]|uniref:Uncharacterized protein n=1 Tax=marine sediment metagenome TaxID=412755 RepID=A0A0F9A9E9_9ZZZZ